MAHFFKKILNNLPWVFVIIALLFLGKGYFKLKKEIALIQPKLEKFEKSENNISSLVDTFNLLDSEEIIHEKLDKLDFISNEVLQKGSLEMKKNRAIFTGITRDNGEYLPSLIKMIEHLGNNFADYRVILFENDSSDTTKMILKYWSHINPKIKIISKNFHNVKRPSIKFMAEARNYYVNELNKEEYDAFDLVIPVDMDMKYGIDIRGIQDSFSKAHQWDVVCSNGISNSKGEMHDAFAFRSEEFPYSPKEYGEKYNKNYWDFRGNISKMQRVYNPEGDLVKVNSCFGGLAIYKKSLFKECDYDSDGDCEHVFLHKCMKSKYDARIFMNPAQIIRYLHYKDKK